MALSPVERWTVLQQETNCLELENAFTNMMLSPPETHSKTGKKVLSPNDFNKVSCTVIFWGMNLYYRPIKYLKLAI